MHSWISSQVSKDILTIVMDVDWLICFLITLDIDDVNKAFEEMHEEVELKMVKTEFDSAMTH